MKTLDEFKGAGGILHGGEQGRSHEEYDGCPRPYNDKLSTTFDKLGLSHHNSDGAKGHRATDSGVGMGQTASSGNAADGLVPGHKGGVTNSGTAQAGSVNPASRTSAV